MKYKRIFLIVLDSVGIGETKDAKKYNDKGANTLLNTIKKTNIQLPNFEKLGLLNLVNISNVQTYSLYTKAKPISKGKDTLTGHLEIMGIKTTKPPITFTKTGFPKKLIEELETKINRKVIGNISASGTKIIKDLGLEHIHSGSIIVYTSGDSVLQIAAHEEIIPLSELYKICDIARNLTLKKEWKVGRIIARPFKGTPNNFTRTENRKDYALNPPSKTVLDNLKKTNFDVITIGKIKDIFNNQGITKSIKTINNKDGLDKLINLIKNESFTGLCFANLNDFDSLYGHRRDPIGYSIALKEVDNYLPEILSNLKNNDLIIFTADHGNDPTYKGTDHTRENVPVLIYSKDLKNHGKIKDLNTFADIGATIANNFKIKKSKIGRSFLKKL